MGHVWCAGASTAAALVQLKLELLEAVETLEALSI